MYPFALQCPNLLLLCLPSVNQAGKEIWTKTHIQLFKSGAWSQLRFSSPISWKHFIKAVAQQNPTESGLSAWDWQQKRRLPAGHAGSIPLFPALISMCLHFWSFTCPPTPTPPTPPQTLHLDQDTWLGSWQARAWVSGSVCLKVFVGQKNSLSGSLTEVLRILFSLDGH